jgi:hypothetical protein
MTKTKNTTTTSSNFFACGKSELSLFDNVPPQVVVESGLFCDIHPTSSIDKSNTIEFLINGSEADYLDLNDTLLHLQCKVTDENGDPLATGATPPNVYLCDYFMNAMFSDVILSLNNVVVEGGNQLYSYKATLEDILNYNSSTSKVQLVTRGCNPAVADRKAEIAGSRLFEMCGSLRLDFFNQPKYLLNSVDVRIQLQRSKTEFCIMSPNAATVGGVKPRLEINKAILYVRRVEVAPAVKLGHLIGLQDKNAIYPFQKTQLLSYSIPSGSLSYFKDNVFSGTLPKLVIVAMTSGKAYNGAYEEEPFTFNHFNINYMALLKDGQSVPYRTVYQPDFANKLYAREFLTSIVQNLQHLNTNVNNGITRDMFAQQGYSLFTFNLTPDYCLEQVQPIKHSNIRLDMRFTKASTTPINVIVYGMFDSELQITKDRQCIVMN